MFSGSDSTESQNYTQWALNPSAYQNMSNEQVDWAALAQQWIIMKEAAVEPPMPIQKQMMNITAPPPPIISKPKKENEGGEAPMDVVNEDEPPPSWNDGGGSNDSYGWNQSGGPQQPWGWNSAWPAALPPNNLVKPPLLPTPAFNQYTSVKEPPNDNANYGSYNTVSQSSPGYWTSASSSSKVIKPHNKRYSKVNVPSALPTKTPVTLDAAKRKQLPAWIREGLEKMERDKLKQIDKIREKHEKNEYEDKLKLREDAMEILKSTVKPTETKHLSAYDDDDSDDHSPPPPPRRSPTPLTHEEMMLKVRRTMTEVLLKVTNREIQNICREELQRHVKKMKASDQRVSAPSGANLSAKLGLGAYDGSGDSSSDSDEASNHGYNDSDSELKDIIRKRKEEFSKTERDIEDRLAEVDRSKSRASTPDSDVQIDAKVPERRSRRSEEGTPPLKVTATSKTSSRNKRQSSETSSSSTDRNSKTSKTKERRSRDRRSSSSDSRYKSKSKRSRSRTPKSKRRRSDSRRSRSNSRRRETRRGDRRSKYSRSRSRSRSYRKRVRSRSRRRSDSRSSYRRSRTRSRSRSSRRYRRSRSYSSGRGKRSHRH